MSNIRATYFLFAMLVFTFFIASGCDSVGNTPALTPTDSETSINSDDETPSGKTNQDDVSKRGQSEKEKENTLSSQTDDVSHDNTVTKDPFIDWKNYVGRGFIFRHPPNWSVMELDAMLIVSDIVTNGEGLPPDIIGAPLTIGRDTASTEEYEMSLREDGEIFVVEDIIIGGRRGKKYTYTTEYFNDFVEIVDYRFPIENEFVTFMVFYADVYGDTVSAILQTLSF